MQVRFDLLDAAALGLGQWEWENLVEPIDHIGRGVNLDAFHVVVQHPAAGQDRQLEGEKFIEGQAAAGQLPGLHVLGVMTLVHGVQQGHQLGPGQDVAG